MKANLKNLIEVLKMRFDGKIKTYVNEEEIYENVDDVDLKNDYVEIGILDCSVPTISDAKAIINCFFINGDRITNIDSSWGLIEIFASDGKLRKKVDIDMVKMALPNTCEEKLKSMK